MVEDREDNKSVGFNRIMDRVRKPFQQRAVHTICGAIPRSKRAVNYTGTPARSSRRQEAHFQTETGHPGIIL